MMPATAGHRLLMPRRGCCRRPYRALPESNTTGGLAVVTCSRETRRVCGRGDRSCMFGNQKLILSGVIISLAAASPAFAHGRALPAGPEWYVDDNGHWRSLREDWRNLQR